VWWWFTVVKEGDQVAYGRRAIWWALVMRY